MSSSVATRAPTYQRGLTPTPRCPGLRGEAHWPTSTNPYLLVSQITAMDNRRPPVTKYFIWKTTTQLGFNATELRADRILDEALHTEDPFTSCRYSAARRPPR
jgi:hypothetical protein